LSGSRSFAATRPRSTISRSRPATEPACFGEALARGGHWLSTPLTGAALRQTPSAVRNNNRWHRGARQKAASSCQPTAAATGWPWMCRGHHHQRRVLNGRAVRIVVDVGHGRVPRAWWRHTAARPAAGSIRAADSVSATRHGMARAAARLARSISRGCRVPARHSRIAVALLTRSCRRRITARAQ
jgi:hypothetical protein